MQENIKGLRTVVQRVVPVQPNEDGLMVALERLSAKTTDLYGVHCIFVCEAPIRLESFELATQLYYIAQEAATNAVKHHSSSSVRVEPVSSSHPRELRRYSQTG